MKNTWLRIFYLFRWSRDWMARKNLVECTKFFVFSFFIVRKESSRIFVPTCKYRTKLSEIYFQCDFSPLAASESLNFTKVQEKNKCQTFAHASCPLLFVPFPFFVNLAFGSFASSLRERFRTDDPHELVVDSPILIQTLCPVPRDTQITKYSLMIEKNFKTGLRRRKK